MNKLSAVEAERVISILDEAIFKMNILSKISVDVDGGLMNRMNLGGYEEVCQALSQQWKVENDHRLSSTSRSTNDLSATNDIEVANRITSSTRRLCREIAGSPGASDLIFGSHRRSVPPPPEVQSFVTYISQLKDIMYRKLSTTVEEETLNRNLLYDLTERERQMSENRDVLREQLESERGEKEKVTLSLEQTIRKLETELNNSTQANKNYLEALAKEMEETLERSSVEHMSRMKKLEESLESLEKKLMEETETNHERELKKRKEKSKLEAAVASKVREYDTDMLSLQRSMEDMQSKMEDETIEYRNLREYFDKLDEDSSRRLEEERILAAVRDREQKALDVMAKAATYFQAVVRGRRARMDTAKMKKGKKGKKGKK